MDATTARWQRIDSLLDRALALPEAQRAAFIDHETADDAGLRRELQALVAALPTRGDFLDAPAVAGLAAATPQRMLAAGTRLGAWRVTALLGRGGMGEVYRGERADGQFEQQVALKLLRPEAVEHLSRFLAERRILATLEHPGIARLYDAGLADDGRPYMVMELVEGLPIVEWCAVHGADLGVRLDLFMQTCAAVAYAHGSLVVHRDLKPANVLVTAAARVKLLDFGVAKLMATADSADTSAPMTPAYAAPEQLEGTAVTTATDVHALGLLLYELLTALRAYGAGEGPLALQLQRVLHGDAPLPSHMARSTRQPPVAARRLAGDLDAIVAKALRKRPAERYATAAALQHDVQRHLAGEPVAARGGARLYVARRFVRRHRWGVAAAMAVFTALAAGLTGTTWQAREARRERDIARTEAARSDAVRDYVMLMFREAGEDAGEGELTARQVLERSARQLVQAPPGRDPQREEIFQLLGELFAAIDDFEGAAPIYRRYLDTPRVRADPALRAEIRHDLAVAEFRLGDTAQARVHLAQAQAFWARDPVRYRESLASSRVVESQLLRERGDAGAAIAALRGGLAERIAISGRSHRETAYLLNALGLALMSDGKLQEADRVLGEALQILVALGRQDSSQGLSMLSNQGVIAATLGDNARAEPLLRRAMELRRKLYGRSAALAALQQNVGRLMVRSGRAAEAHPLLQDAWGMAREFTGEDSPMSLTIALAEAEARIAMDDAGAEAALASAMVRVQAHLGRGHVLHARGEQLLARLRLQQGRPAEARVATDRAERALLALGPAAAPYLAEIARLRSGIAGAQVSPRRR